MWKCLCLMRKMKFTLCFSIFCLISVVSCGSGLKNKLRHILSTEAKQYYISENPDNFFQAYRSCRTQDMQLLTITSATESEAINQVLKGSGRDPSQPIWTSGNRLESEVTFFWQSTGRFVTYTDWLDGEPSKGDELCIEIGTRGGDVYRWNDVACDVNRHFICETASCSRII